jgi:site-specific recombinase XerD
LQSYLQFQEQSALNRCNGAKILTGNEVILMEKNKKTLSYDKQIYVETTERLRQVLSTLPPFAGLFFRAIEPHTTVRTRISYSYDLRVFFRFITEHDKCGKKDILSLDITDLDKITSLDLEEYMEYLKTYSSDDDSLKINTEQGLRRKLASLKSFYHYYYKHQMIKNDPTVIVELPKLHHKEIIRLEPNEVAELLDLVEHGGDNLTGMKKVYYEKNKLRNLAIITLMLGTGIRVSECVGLDLQDVDFDNGRIRIIRKGGKEDFVYFGEEVSEALEHYLEERKKIETLEGHENALFLSIRRRRITIQGIEDLVRDFASQVTTLKHITPHKLRSTFGTNLYRETDDIYLVAEVLGHNDINTTKKHYAATDEYRKRHAAKMVKLRKA